jgi:hypothetical protein
MCLACQKSTKNTPMAKKSECGYLYTELTNLDLQILDMYKVNKDAQLLGVNKTLRTWITNLYKECPPSADLNVIREFIKDEYSKYYPE